MHALFSWLHTFFGIWLSTYSTRFAPLLRSDHDYPNADNDGSDSDNDND